ncbi:MORC family CW-type zinc finger protein 3-like isoform X2 [Gossypium australe]|uniref:MORC family CW-type zinc finger protein 3-like isoform X2 n=1 Tax=Gossypium australe TaxID=47621 RepID=A0A5B6VZP7_9ROSI|nr:MORC family CW-type zinc finger protein 3-like isoform X2 [Gossypium australe]
MGYQPPGFAAKQKKLLANQHNNSSNLPAGGKQDSREEQPGLDVPDVVMPEGDLASISVDQLCEENIQLFMRCEEKAQKEADLKQTVRITYFAKNQFRVVIEELEKGLEDIRKKCAHLSSLLESKRKQKVT